MAVHLPCFGCNGRNSPALRTCTTGKVRRFSVPEIKVQKMRENLNATSTVVARVNNVDIVVMENGMKKVPVKPICEALGIAFEPQFTRLKNDPILSSVITLSVTTGADGKQYEMVTIPFKYVFGWLFRIDSRNVKEEARESVLKYQVQCYDALYNHFTIHYEYVEWKSKLVEEQTAVVEAINANFRHAKDLLITAKDELNRRRRLSLSDYISERSQLRFKFEEE